MLNTVDRRMSAELPSLRLYVLILPESARSHTVGFLWWPPILLSRNHRCSGLRGAKGMALDPDAPIH